MEEALRLLFPVMGRFDPSSLHASPTAITSIDPLLRSQRELIADLTALVDYPANLQVSVAALQVLDSLCDDPRLVSPMSVHRLVTILQESNRLGHLMEAFLARLEREEPENCPLSLINSGRESDLESFGLTNVIRLQIVILLMKNIQRPYYTIAHWLLGFPFGENLEW